jgi:hypothetical protein
VSPAEADTRNTHAIGVASKTGRERAHCIELEQPSQASGLRSASCVLGRAGAVLTAFVYRWGMRRVIAVLLLACPLAVAAPPTVRADPASLFDGRSTGHGELTLLFGRARPFRVESEGRRQSDGSFRLDQVVSFEGETPRARHWIIRPAGEGRFVFSLSDAAGPGTAVVDGSRLTLRYPLTRGGVRMRQVLEVSPDGRSIANTGSIRWWGIPIGRLTETIVRMDNVRKSDGDR